MNDDFVPLGIAVGMIISLAINYLVETSYVSLEKENWKCSQSKILDPNDVDKIECISYRKLLKDEQ